MPSCALRDRSASVPALSLEPVFRRSHGSLYKALDRGRIDEERLRSLLVAHRPEAWPLVFAVDASTWDRCDAECSPERGFYYSASKHSAGQPIVAGWNYQWICQLDWAYDSWTAPLDVERIPPEPGQLLRATAAQIRQTRSDFFRAMGKSLCSSSTPATTRSPWVTIWPKSVASVLTRIRDDRVFYADPPPRFNAADGNHGGRPARHGTADSSARTRSTWAQTRSASLRATDPRYGTVKRRSAWHGLHPRVIGRGRWSRARRRTADRARQSYPRRSGALAQARLWGRRRHCGCFGPGLASLISSDAGGPICGASTSSTPSASSKHTLGWTTPSLCTPEQADRWSWLIVASLDPTATCPRPR